MFSVVTIFLLAIVPLRMANTSEVRSSYGQPCNETTPCKASPHLVCSHETKTCSCFLPDDMQFDSNYDRCVRLVRTEGCRSETTHPSCVEGAICVQHGRSHCECPRTHYEHPETRTCVPAKGIQNTCSSQVECDRTMGLACVAGTCNCFAPDDMEFDNKIGECRIKLGHKCIDLIESILHEIPVFDEKIDSTNSRHKVGMEIFGRSTASDIRSAFSTSICARGSGCHPETNICTECGSREECFCSEDQYLNETSGRCIWRKDQGESCFRDRECRQLMICREGICSCNEEVALITTTDYGPHSFGGHWVHKGDCVGKVGSYCLSKSAYDTRITHRLLSYCREGAICGDNHRCACPRNMPPVRGGHCGRNYDEWCTLEEPCQDYLICSSIEHYHLMKCRCPGTNYQFHENSNSSEGCPGICRNRHVVGRRCNTSDGVDPCVKNSHCVIQASANGTTGICECKPGFLENSEHHCDIEHGFPCDYENRTERCDKVADLKCRIVPKCENGKQSTELVQVCSCPELEDIYEPVTRKCLPPTRENIARSVIRDTNCHQSNEDNLGFITCKTGG
ncbi:cell death abnormality protein 1 [Folsomia candida]|uniref:cell death abnormality protein 1 n=1 Tax=Folsomia candida TaxID=158441 RepID=UPI001604AE2A|nr:cell death abnormality protein 1 [Folsomia candida]